MYIRYKIYCKDFLIPKLIYQIYKLFVANKPLKSQLLKNSILVIRNAILIKYTP